MGDDVSEFKTQTKGSRMIIINEAMRKYMMAISDEFSSRDDTINSYFVRDDLLCLNKSIHKNNYYARDKYGILVRKEAYGDTKSEFGWKYNSNHEIVNIHVDDFITTTHPPQEVTSLTLKKLMTMYPKAFAPKSAYGKLLASIKATN